MPIPADKTAVTGSAITRATKEAAERGTQIKLTDWEPTAPGLHICISPKGLCTWKVRASGGATAALGRYPGMTIAKAREAARTAHQKIKDGVNLTAEKREKKAVAKADKGHTLETLLDAYGKRVNVIKSFDKSLRKTIKPVFKEILHRHLSELTKVDFNQCLDSYPAKHSANAAQRSINPVLDWAAEHVHGFNTALCRLKKPHKIVSRRQRFLDDDELAAVLKALSVSKTETNFPTAMRFLMLTASRLNETCEATWSEFDLDTGVWTIPGHRIKNTKPGEIRGDHVLDLSAQALAILKEQKKAMKKKSDFVFPNKVGNAFCEGNWARFRAGIKKASNTTGWHCHDLRRTMTTQLERHFGYHTDTLSALLNHVVGTYLDGTYTVAPKYRPQVKQAMQEYADLLDRLCNNDVEQALSRNDEMVEA